MCKKNNMAFLLAIAVSFAAFAQTGIEEKNEDDPQLTVTATTVMGNSAVTGNSIEEKKGDGPKLTLTGSLVGMASIGLMEDDQAAMWNANELPPGATSAPKGAPGVFYPGVEDFGVIPNKHGYYVLMDFGMLYNPIPSVDIFALFRGVYRPGSPYIPMQLEEYNASTFTDFTLYTAYGQMNIIEGLGFESPLDLWLKVGKFDTQPKQVNRFAKHSSEKAGALGSLRTTNQYALQLSASYLVPMTKGISASFTTNAKLKDSVQVLLDEDENFSAANPLELIIHGDWQPFRDIPFHTTLRMDELEIGNIGTLSAEFIYAYNAMNVYSGNNYGGGLGFTLTAVDNLTLPIGVGVALYGKNIDPFAGMGKDIPNNKNFIDYINFYRMNGYHFSQVLGEKSWDANTASFRQAMRLSADLGASYDFNGVLKIPLAVDLDGGYTYSQIVHVYRDTLTLNSLTAGLRITYDNHYFVGGGIFLGTLGDVEWKTKDDVDAQLDGMGTSDNTNTGTGGYSHQFNADENMGFEVYGGIKFKNAEFVVGYNVNKGLSMNNYIESIPEAQIKYRQEGTLFDQGLFERGGFFTKLSLSW